MLLQEVGKQEEVEEKKPILVNGEEVSTQKFQELQTDQNIRLKKLEENSFKVLQKLQG